MVTTDLKMCHYLSLLKIGYTAQQRPDNCIASTLPRLQIAQDDLAELAGNDDAWWVKACVLKNEITEILRPKNVCLLTGQTLPNTADIT